jgi:hypothetical protein
MRASGRALKRLPKLRHLDEALHNMLSLETASNRIRISLSDGGGKRAGLTASSLGFGALFSPPGSLTSMVTRCMFASVIPDRERRIACQHPFQTKEITKRS